MGHRLMVMGGQRFELFTHLPIASHKLPFTRQRLELFSLIFSHSGPGATGLDALQPCLHVQFFRGRSLTEKSNNLLRARWRSRFCTLDGPWEPVRKPYKTLTHLHQSFVRLQLELALNLCVTPSDRAAY